MTLATPITSTVLLESIFLPNATFDRSCFDKFLNSLCSWLADMARYTVAKTSQTLCVFPQLLILQKCKKLHDIIHILVRGLQFFPLLYDFKQFKDVYFKDFRNKLTLKFQSW